MSWRGSVEVTGEGRDIRLGMTVIPSAPPSRQRARRVRLMSSPGSKCGTADPKWSRSW